MPLRKLNTLAYTFVCFSALTDAQTPYVYFSKDFESQGGNEALYSPLPGTGALARPIRGSEGRTACVKEFILTRAAI